VEDEPHARDRRPRAQAEGTACSGPERQEALKISIGTTPPFSSS
jgi:hypothetical protein